MNSPKPSSPAGPPGGLDLRNCGRAAAGILVLAWRELQARPWVAAAWLGAIAVGSYAVHGIDRAAIDWVAAHQQPAVRRMAEGLYQWGKLHLAPAFALAALALAGVAWRRAELGLAAGSGALAALVAGVLVQVVKAVVGRPRPFVGVPDGFYWFESSARYHSFPSGHALHCFAIVGAVVMLAPRTGAALAVLAAAVTVSRCYVQAHFPSDLLAGALLGLGIGLLFGLAGRKRLEGRRAACSPCTA